MNKENLKKVMSELGKLSHKKNPRSKKWYQEFSRKGALAANKKRAQNKLSTPPLA